MYLISVCILKNQDYSETDQSIPSQVNLFQMMASSGSHGKSIRTE